MQVNRCGSRALHIYFTVLGWSTIGLTGLLFSCLLVNYSEEICRCIFDIEVFVLASPALCSENAAAMDIFEIPICKFVMPPTFFSVLVVYRQEPLSVLGEAVLFDEFFFGLRGRMMVAPRVPFVIGKLTLLDKSLGVFICALVQLHRHAVYLFTELRLENRQRLPH